MTERRQLTITVLDDYQRAAEQYLDLDVLRDLVDPVLQVHYDHAADEATLVNRIRSADVVVCIRERSLLSRSVIAQLDRTRLIVTTGPRNASIDVAAATEYGITVSGTRGYESSPAELTWALILAMLRRIPAEDDGVRRGLWGLHVGETVQHKTLGVVGLGHLGRQVARVAKAFDMRVLAWSRTLTQERAAAHGCEAVDLDTLLRESDIVSLHLRLNEETRGIIGWPQLGMMKRSAYLVNTARGALVNEAALCDALRLGKIAGAALDVYEQEPLPQTSPLREFPQVVLTPHIGYVTKVRYQGFFEQVVEDIRYHLLGRPIRTLSRPYTGPEGPRSGT